MNLRGKKEIKSKKSCKKDASNTSNEDQEMVDEDEESDEKDESMTEQSDIKMEDLKVESEVFTLTYSNKEASTSTETEDAVVTVKNTDQTKNIFMPHPRRSSYLQFHKGILYLYGGKYEDKNDKEFTFNDLYCLNIKKLDEWKTLYEDKELHLELKKLAENSDMEEDDSEDNDEDEEEEDEDDDEDEDSDVEINAPKAEPNETLDEYFERTNDVWMTEAQNEFPNEKSKKILKKMALELCKMFWESIQSTTKKTSP